MAAIALAAGPLALTGSAAGTLTMNAKLLLQGHARAGAWAAVEVDLQNDGPAISGELRMDGGSQSNARYGMAVNLPTTSRQTFILHVQPPAFGRTVKVDLVSGDKVIDSVSVAYLVHESTQLVVGVLAERSQALIGEIDLPPNTNGARAAIVPLTVADLPDRAEGWSVLDRLVWQDVDSNQLSTEQIGALRHWLAAGGRLVIVGGSAGISTMSAFPDDILPYRPTATLDIDPTSLVSLLGPLPANASQLPAMAGPVAHGRALATSGDQAVAAELTYGSGRVTLLGFDPTTKWLAESKSVEAMWRAALPARTADGAQLIDDTQLVQSVYQLPSLRLPPTSGLLILIGAYIVIIGPINYFVLKRLDRRELAWITMPLLVLAFTAASFGYGFLLRGTDVLVNEVALVRGAPDATEASAQVYFGVFSPTRATYQVSLPQGALVAAPIADPLGQGGSTLDILQGTGQQLPSMVRNLSVGTSSLRVVRAELPVEAPRMKASLALDNNELKGTFENLSDEKLESVAVVLGSAVAVLGDVDAHTRVSVSFPVRGNPFGAPLADQIIGRAFEQTTESGVRRAIRYGMVNQLTYDPSRQFSNGVLPADQAVILAFDRRNLLDVQLGGQEPRRSANVMYYVPVPVSIHGPVTFSSDLLRATVVESDAQFFGQEGTFLNMGLGTATLSYRPIPYDGTFTVSQIRLSLGNNANAVLPNGKEIRPMPSIPVACTDVAHTTPRGCQAPRNDFLPEVEVFDRSGEGTWVRLPRLTAEAGYTLADPNRYVDPATGQVLVRFVNESPDPGSAVGFSFQLALVGAVE
ncbi:MAG TPA: hypothetical protein VL749_06060 [Patescibacteria group bacterium]|nr:hypothetical protein [Patescibacteria group bacterium]